MANEEHVTILKRGVKLWNAWRKENPNVLPDLIDLEINGHIAMLDLDGIDLSDAVLTGAKLSHLGLFEADLRRAKLGAARLTAVTLMSADLRGIDLVIATVHDSDLRYVDLTSALLVATNFNQTNLSGAKFNNARVHGMTLADCDLRGCKGLDSVVHKAPSTVGIDTVYRSGGDISESFLRNCGVPENLIQYIPSLVNSEEGIQFYSCFISYSSKDEEFARRVHGRMRDARLRVWFAPEDMPGGMKLHEVIDEAIRVYDKLLIVLSEASLRSEWVMTELRKARKAERQSGKRKLFPVRLADFTTLRDWECFDADSGKDLAVELREYFIPDFSNWKDHDSFETAFARLLKDLQSS